MSIFQSATEKHKSNLGEEYLYGIVAKEMADSQISPGLYAKALAESDGNEQKAQARYIKLRVGMLKTEAEANWEQQSLQIEQLNRTLVASVPEVVEPKPEQSKGGSNIFLVLAFLGNLAASAILWFVTIAQWFLDRDALQEKFVKERLFVFTSNAIAFGLLLWLISPPRKMGKKVVSLIVGAAGAGLGMTMPGHGLEWAWPIFMLIVLFMGLREIDWVILDHFRTRATWKSES